MVTASYVSPEMKAGPFRRVFRFNDWGFPVEQVVAAVLCAVLSRLAENVMNTQVAPSKHEYALLPTPPKWLSLAPPCPTCKGQDSG